MWQPAHDYFEKKVSNDLKEAVSAFKFARYFNPTKVVELQPTVSDLDNLLVFPFLNSHIIDQLKLELPKYLASAEEISSTQDPVGSKVCKEFLLIQPSSAAAERVFSILSNSFSVTQRSSLEDYCGKMQL